MTTTLKLKLSSGTGRISKAWFLPGEDPDAWLSEVCTWSSSTDGYRFVPLAKPGSTDSDGVFVILPQGVERSPGSRGQPYAEISTGFYVPVDAGLWPPVESGELKSLSVFAIYIFHPSFGLFGVGDEEVLSTMDLLKAPTLRDGNWNIAQSPQTGNQKLRSVRLEAPLILADIFGDESREIGSEPISDLTPEPSETLKNIPGEIAQRVFGVFVGGLIRLTALVPRSKFAAPNWINHLENWAQQKLSGVFAELEKSRNAEIDKLMELLEKNPEEGLKHSISLADLAQRGRAQASAKLARRTLDFDIRRLGGGGPSDNWNLGPDARNNLIRLYRDNAQRESRLGRHRRAAYIYAELLGDLSSAADALKQGRFFREAALLYKERLFKPIVAAECLVEGGCLHEAIEIYESHKCWLEVAPLYTKLGEDDEAKAALRKAYEVYVNKGDIISAARLLESKLLETEEALNLLAATWPDGRQAMECLEEQFALLNRLLRFKDLRGVIDTLGKSTMPARRIADVINLVSRTNQSCADPGVRRISKEVVIQKVSVALSEKSLETGEEIGVLRSLTRVSPDDRLLTRDVNRFRTSRGGNEVIKRLPPPSRILKKLTVEKTKTHEFPRIGGWIVAAGIVNGMVAVSRLKNGKVFFTRGTWTSAQQSVDWREVGQESGSVFYLHARNDCVTLGQPLAAPLKMQDLPSADAFDGIKCSVGTPAWLPQDTVQLSEAKGIYWVIRLANSRPVLCSFQYGKQLYSRDIREELAVALEDGESAGIFVDALGSDNAVAVGFCKSLLFKTYQNALILRKFERQITGLLPSHPSIPGWIVLHDHGASFVTAHGFKILTLNDDVPSPRAMRLGDGRVILLSGESGSVFQRVDTILRPSGIFTIPSSETNVIGVMPTSIADEFAIAYSTGVFQRWKVGV